MIQAAGYDNTAIIPLELEEIAHWRQQPATRLWLDLANPTADDLAFLQRRLQINEQHIADCLLADGPRYLDRLNRYLFLRLDGPLAEEAALTAAPLTFILGENYLATVHEGRFAPLSRLWERAQEEMELWRHGHDYLLRHLLKSLVEAHFNSYRQLSPWPDAPEAAASQPANGAHLAQRQEKLLRLAYLTGENGRLLKELAGEECEWLDANINHYLARDGRRLAWLAGRLDNERQLLAQKWAAALQASARRRWQMAHSLLLTIALLLLFIFLAGLALGLALGLGFL